MRENDYVSLHALDEILTFHVDVTVLASILSDTGRHQVVKLLHESLPKEVRRSMIQESGILAQRNLPQVKRQRTNVNDPNENGQLGLINHDTDVGKNKIQTYPVEDKGEKAAGVVVDSESNAHRSQMMIQIWTSFVST